MTHSVIYQEEQAENRSSQYYNTKRIVNAIKGVGNNIENNTALLDKIFFKRYWAQKINFKREEIEKKKFFIKDDLNFLNLLKEVFNNIGISTMFGNLEEGWYYVEEGQLYRGPAPYSMSLMESLSAVLYNEKEAHWDYQTINILFFFKKMEENRLDKAIRSEE